MDAENADPNAAKPKRYQTRNQTKLAKPKPEVKVAAPAAGARKALGDISNNASKKPAPAAKPAAATKRERTSKRAKTEVLALFLLCILPTFCFAVLEARHAS